MGVAQFAAYKMTLEASAFAVAARGAPAHVGLHLVHARLEHLRVDARHQLPLPYGVLKSAVLCPARRSAVVEGHVGTPSNFR